MGYWESILQKLKEHLEEGQFDLWFTGMGCESISEDTLHLRVPNEHYKNWIENKYKDLIYTIVVEVFGSRKEIIISTEPMVGQQPVQQELPLTESAKPTSSPAVPRISSEPGFEISGLNPDYTFDSFVVGPSNQFAYAAALAVSEAPARNYNPLFIYGGVGLGKTHLLHAIGNSALVNNPRTRVAYRTSEQFMNELILSIEKREMAAFRERYRSECDVLLIDDIQFIAGKERTQEEFFHTFNALYNNLKQIVLISDKTPQEIPKLEERLQSRFSWGLLADIQRPEMETRVAILKKKAAQVGVIFPDDVGIYIANHIDSNIRELEGSLRRIAARAELQNATITLDLAKKVLEPFLKKRAASITPDRIVRLVASYYNIKVNDIRGRGRSRQIALPRQISMYLSRKHTELSYPELGRSFGKDHTTVINAFQKVDKLMREDLSVKSDVEALERNLLS